MQLDFVKLSPTQNMTVIVTTPVARARQAALAEKLMAGDSIGGEQVGYLERATLPGARARLQMMGGEFCGNAAMSLAALFARADGLDKGEDRDYCFEVSGANSLVHCRITAEDDGYAGTVAMPLPERVMLLAPEEGCALPAVVFPGITHLLVRDPSFDASLAEAKIAAWCRRLGADALGILLLSDNDTRMRPLVYVESTSSCVWEHGCGSGSAAIGAWRALHAQCNQTRIGQPGGTITARADVQNGQITALTITGDVRIVAEGQAYIREK